MSDKQRLRLAIDCHPCVSQMSKNRGVGRYVHELLTAYLSAFNDGVDVMLPLNYADSCVDYRTELVRLSTKNTDLHSRHFLLSSAGADGFDQARISEANAISMAQSINRLGVDFFVLSHAFEGWMGGAVSPPPTLDRHLNIPYGIIAYDVIPLELPEIYIKDDKSRAWYLAQCRLLTHAKLVFCISGYTADSLHKYLGIPRERLIVIHGGASNAFHKLESHQLPEAQNDLWKLGIVGPFLLCTGGDDPRKNLECLIRAYSIIAKGRAVPLQLVVVCKLSQGSRDRLMAIARETGIRAGELVLTGYVSDETLNLLYNRCEVFVFPSLVEGLGFPLLEAMATGACTMGSDSSSIREVLDDPDCLFDPSSAEDIAARILRVLNDPELRERLKAKSLIRSANFSWTRAIQTMRSAILSEVTEQTLGVELNNCIGRPRMAFFSPVPPQGSGIAAYSADLLPALSKFFDITVVYDGEMSAVGEFMTSVDCISHLHFYGGMFEYIVYQFGNSHYHRYMLPFIEKNPGVIVMHDTYVSGFWGWMGTQPGYEGCFEKILSYSHPDHSRGDNVDRPMGRMLLDSSVGAIVLCEADYNETMASYSALEPKVEIVSSVCSAPLTPPAVDERNESRRRLHIDPKTFVVSLFGHIGPQKKYDFILKGLAVLIGKTSRQIKLCVVGPLGSEAYQAELESLVSSLGLEGVCEFAGRVDDDRYNDFVAASDLGVTLRDGKTGLVSRALLCNLAAGLPTVVNDAGFFSSLPDNVVLKFPTDDLSAFTRILEDCANGVTDLESMKAAAHQYVVQQHSPSFVAKGYRDAILKLYRDHAGRSPGGAARKIVSLSDGSRKDLDSELFKKQAPCIGVNRPHAVPRTEKRPLLIWVDHTCRYDGNSGIQRVVRSLLRGLELEGRQFHLVKWNSNRDGFAFCDFEDYAVLRKFGGPRLVERPIQSWSATNGQWFPPYQSLPGGQLGYTELNETILIVPELQPGNEPQIGSIIAHAHNHGARIGAIFFDAIICAFPDAYSEGEIGWITTYMRQLANADFVIPISHDARMDLEKMWEERNLSPRPQVNVAHLAGEFPETVRSEKTPSKGGSDLPMILCVGTIRPHKNQLRLIEAFKLMQSASSRPTAKLKLMGDIWPPLEPVLKDAIGDSTLIEWIRSPSDEEIGEAYSRCSFTVFPSLKEGFGLPILESIWFGKPVVCHNGSAMLEVAESGGGCITTEMSDASKIAEAMTRLVTDFPLIEKMSNECLSRPMKTWAEYSSEVTKIVDSACII